MKIEEVVAEEKAEKGTGYAEQVVVWTSAGERVYQRMPGRRRGREA